MGRPRRFRWPTRAVIRARHAARIMRARKSAGVPSLEELLAAIETPLTPERRADALRICSAPPASHPQRALF